MRYADLHLYGKGSSSIRCLATSLPTTIITFDMRHKYQFGQAIYQNLNNNVSANYTSRKTSWRKN